VGLDCQGRAGRVYGVGVLGGGGRRGGGGRTLPNFICAGSDRRSGPQDGALTFTGYRLGAHRSSGGSSGRGERQARHGR